MNKKLICFDLDSTLAESKSPITPEMADSLAKLLKDYKVAIISGGAWPQFESQLLSNLSLSDGLKRKLYLLPTCGSQLYFWNTSLMEPYTFNWHKIFSISEFSQDQKNQIFKAFEKCFEQVGFEPLKDLPYGDIIEDRGTQITFSALGQQAPVDLKKKWDSDLSKRTKMVEILQKELPYFEVRFGGSTSIDVTTKNIDKAFGINTLNIRLDIEIDEMLFVGDSIYEGGNDYAVIKTGIDYIKTSGPEETITIIKNLLDGNHTTKIL